MGSVEVLMLEDSKWKGVDEFLCVLGVEVHHKPRGEATAVVLGGRGENPVVLQGMSVLAFDSDEWTTEAWPAYAEVLEEYYDYMMDLTGLTDEEKADAVRDFTLLVDG